MSQPRIQYDEISDSLTVCFAAGVVATGIELTDHILVRLNQQRRQVQFLQLSAYTPSIIETIPVISLQPLAVAVV